jgi:hypothetical protein
MKTQEDQRWGPCGAYGSGLEVGIAGRSFSIARGLEHIHIGVGTCDAAFRTSHSLSSTSLDPILIPWQASR